MYKIIGGDGKEYGPISAEQLRDWITQGRINAKTSVQRVGSPEWKPAPAWEELASAFPPVRAGGMAPPPIGAPEPVGPRQSGMATGSLVLGILSVTCFWFVAAIPAIILGHIAQGRARKMPAVYGGGGMAIAGLVLGYCSLALSLLVLPGMLLPALSHAKAKAVSISCMNNMRQIGLAARIWAGDHGDAYPFNVSTNQGGTLELCARGSDGFDQNSALHFAAMSKELFTTKILLCPGDSAKEAALDFQTLLPANVSYQLRTGKNVSEINPNEILAICPIHGHILMVDGSVVQGHKKR